MHYLVEANLYLAAFYALYLIFLRGETHYQLNRAYLLSTSLLAFIIPFFQLGALKPGAEVLQQHISIGELAATGYTTQVLPDTVIAAATPKYTLNDYLLFIYAGVAIVLLINLAMRIYLLIALARKGSVTKNAAYKVIELHQGSVAFSFFNNLFIDDRLASSQTILYHEQVHIRQKHSWDIIYLEIVKIISWFNPVVYLLIASIKEVHEFIADEETAGLENNNDSYTDFLISNAYGITQNSLTNSFFNKNLLKRRITMLYQKRSGKSARLKYLLALPLMFGLLCVSTLAFTAKTYALVIAPHQTAATAVAVNQIKGPATSGYTNGYQDATLEHKKNTGGVSIKSLPLQNNLGGKVFTEVEVLPEFPGGEHALGQFLGRNIHYPAADKANKIHGKVYAKFIVETNGSISDIKILRTPSAAMGTEVQRVLNLSPKWNPGKQNGKTVRVEFVLPVDFNLTSMYPPGPPQRPQPASGPQSKPGPLPKSVTVTEDDTHTNPNAVYNAVDVQPEFPGGEPGLVTFLQKNIRYPLAAKEGKIQGKVYVQFVVEKDGSIGDIKIVREPGGGTGEEAIRVMKLSPKWIPGTLASKPVRVMFTLPINFSLGDRTADKTYDELYKYIQKYVRYPAAARDKDIQGRVFVQFLLNADKRIQHVKILRTPDEALSTELVRVLQQFDMPLNVKTGVTYVIPVSFYIAHNDGDNKDTDKQTPNPGNGKDTTTPFVPKDGDRVMLNEVVVTTYKP